MINVTAPEKPFFGRFISLPITKNLYHVCTQYKCGRRASFANPEIDKKIICT